jgi:hypothetical protein
VSIVKNIVPFKEVIDWTNSKQLAEGIDERKNKQNNLSNLQGGLRFRVDSLIVVPLVLFNFILILKFLEIDITFLH